MVKYTLEVAPAPSDAPLTVDTFTEQHGLTLRVTQYTDHYKARYEQAEVKDGGLLSGVWGMGETPEAAITDYAKKISGRLLVIDAYLGTRREIRVPRLVVE